MEEQNYKKEDYIKKGKLGEGAFGKTYTVLNKKNNKFYAMKEIFTKDEATKNEVIYQVLIMNILLNIIIHLRTMISTISLWNYVNI